MQSITRMEEALNKQFAALSNHNTPKEGQVWKHYQGNKYQIRGYSMGEEDDELYVLCDPTIAKLYIPWSVKLSEWMETVEVNGEKVPKYTLVKRKTDKMDEIYQEMITRNEKNLLRDGCNVDFLLGSVTDTRYCTALYSFGDELHFNTAFLSMFENMEEQFPDQCMYYRKWTRSECIFHNTFMQLVGFNDFTEENHNQWVENIDKMGYKHFNPYSIQLRGLVAVPSGILVKGYPNIDINVYRKAIREEAKQLGLPLLEPYKNDIAHCTLLRLKTNVDPSKLIEFCKKYQDVDFGHMVVTSLYLGKGTWKMSERQDSKLIHLIDE